MGIARRQNRALDQQVNDNVRKCSVTGIVKPVSPPGVTVNLKSKVGLKLFD